MYKSYIDSIRTQLTLQPPEWYFKSDGNYTRILEHVNPYHGNQYLDIIKNKFETFYESNCEFLKNLCNLNDTYGRTKKTNFKNFIECSPTNLRYILHSLLILEDMKKNKLNNIDIIEIGGGYGGLCLFMHNIAALYDININSYTIFDLLEVSQLQKKYLNALNIKNVNCCQLDNFNNLKNNSYLISNYAFSEISKELQIKYSEKIINPYTASGFLAWNAIPVYSFAKNSITEKEKEYPQTGGSSNYYVRYYPNVSL